MSTALITGAAGQDGRLLAARLVERGLDVVGVVRPGSPPPEGLPRQRTVELDLRDAAALAALVRELRPAQVFHLAAQHHATQESGRQALPATHEAMVAVNFEATRALAFALLAQPQPGHLVLAASSQMYRAPEADVVVDEATPTCPATFYGHTKAWGSALLGTLRRDFGLRASVAVLFNHESPLRRPAFVSRKVSMAAAAAALGHPVDLQLLNLGARTDWCSAHDAVDALLSMADQPEGGDFVLASGQLHTVSELVALAFEHVSLDWRRFTTGREDRRVPALVGRPHKAEAVLGWRRAHTLRDVVAQMVEHDLRLLRGAA